MQGKSGDQYSLELTPTKLPSQEHALKGVLYLNQTNFESLYKVAGSKSRKGEITVKVNNFVLKAEPLETIEQGQVGTNSFFREMFNISVIDKIIVKPFIVKDLNPLSDISIIVEHKITNKNKEMRFDDDGNLIFKEDDLSRIVLEFFKNKYVNVNEKFAITLYESSLILICQVEKITPIDIKSNYTYGIVEFGDQQTDVLCKAKFKDSFKIESNRASEKQIFKKNMNFQELGIGGLDKEFNEIFRRAFNSRRYPQQLIQKYGIKHVKGLLLYGPPGTGKTLIARKISDALNCEKPQVVNGPEIFDKFVGGSEEKIRKLFEPAEKEMKEKGGDSDLHVIIFDEIDAICRARGSTGNSGTGVNESVVNQLLSKMDGVDSLDNILIIGMTNRKDMLDEAILRPGRLEIHLEIGLPDLNGRKQIFEIHTRQMRKNNLLGKDVDIEKLALSTKNYTGAEIEAVCRSATSFALFDEIGQSSKGASSVASEIKVDKKNKNKFEVKIIHHADFERALSEIKPSFGMDNSGLENKVIGGFYNYGQNFKNLYKISKDFINQIKNSENTQLLTLLLEGKQGSGKTALAAKLALESDFPFVKLISPENFVGTSEIGKIHQIVKIFEDAYKSTLSLIILDDIERLIEFIHIGPRFSNPVLQALLVLIKKTPPTLNRKLMIIGTTSMKQILQEMELVDCFNVCQSVPMINSSEEIQAILNNFNCSQQVAQKIGNELESQYQIDGGISIKNFTLAIELSLQKSSQKSVEFNFLVESINSIQNNNIM